MVSTVVLNISWCRFEGSCNIGCMIRLLALPFLLGSSILMAEVARPDGVLPAYVLQLPDSVDDILIVETDSSTMYRFGQGDDALENRGTHYVSIGENGVGKQRPWDRRTPLGIYFISEQLDTRLLHEKYGPTAFPLDYPNVRDRSLRRGGDGIWIHGVAPQAGNRPPRDTDGCIALRNDELLAIADKLLPLVTPVVITRKIDWRRPQQIAALREELNAALDAWAKSYESGDLHRYLSSYADNFEYRGMIRSEWAAFRTATFTNVVRSLALDDVLLLADPEESDLYLSRFRQEISDDERTVATIKRLYWQRSVDGKLRIIAEDNG